MFLAAANFGPFWVVSKKIHSPTGIFVASAEGYKKGSFVPLQ